MREARSANSGGRSCPSLLALLLFVLLLPVVSTRAAFGPPSRQPAGKPNQFPWGLVPYQLPDTHQRDTASFYSPTRLKDHSNPQETSSSYPTLSAALMNSSKKRAHKARTEETSIPFTRCLFQSLNSDGANPDPDFLDPINRFKPPSSMYQLPELQSSQAKEENLPNSSPYLPDGCYTVERTTQETVACSGENMTQIPEFSYARNIKHLHFIETGIQRVTNLDALPRSLDSLYFSDGVLQQFDGRKLYQVSGLQALTISYNPMNSWSFIKALYQEDAPISNTLTYINLQNNLITYPPDPYPGVFENETVLPYLEIIIMNNNPMRTLPGKLFKPLVDSPVHTLLLRNCLLQDFYASPLEFTTGLRVLDLSNNMGLSTLHLTVLLAPLEDKNLQELYIGNNNYGTVPTDALALVNASLQVLDLHGSIFPCLDNTSFPVMPQLRHLNLMYCRINTIHPGAFDGFPLLEELNLDGNALETIPNEALLPSLQVLTMSENPRSTGNSGETLTFSIEQVDFSSMENLTNLTLQQVPLGKITVSDFSDLHNLRYLTLSSCSISYIDPYSFQTLSKLEKLYLNDNDLHELYNNTFAGLVSLTHLILSDNKIVFSSHQETLHAMPVIPVVSNKRITNTSLAEKVMEVLSGQQLNGLPSHQKSENLIPNINLGNKGLKVLNTPFTDLTTLQYLDLSENKIDQIFFELWEDLQNLTYLDLDANIIESWKVPVLTNLTSLLELNLSRNTFTVVTEAMMADFTRENLVSVDLTGNVFECSCALTNIDEGFNTSRFVEGESYTCTQEDESFSVAEYVINAPCNEIIGTSPPPNNINTPANHLLSISIALGVSVFLVMTSIIVYRKRWYLRYVAYAVRKRKGGQGVSSDQYHYDTFVSYCQADRQWVFEHLLPKLEDNGRYQVCVHERDFTVGQEITENIINSVEKSRKVVVVVSPSFVESSWCMFELQMASNKILDERKWGKLIVVLLEPVPEDRQPKTLKYLLRTRTYLPWTPQQPAAQKLFWARLLNAVAKTSAGEVGHPDAATYL